MNKHAIPSAVTRQDEFFKLILETLLRIEVALTQEEVVTDATTEVEIEKKTRTRKK